MSHAPGLDRDTWLEPGDGTKGVTIEAIATGDPERSWIVTDQPFLSVKLCSFPAVNDDNLQNLQGISFVVSAILYRNQTRFFSITTIKPNRNKPFF